MKKVTLDEFLALVNDSNSFGAYIKNTRILITKEAVIDWAKEAATKGTTIEFLHGHCLGSSVIVLNSSSPSHYISGGDR